MQTDRAPALNHTVLPGGLPPAALLGAIVLFAFALRLACVLVLNQAPYGDFLAYFTMASNLYDGKGLLDFHGQWAFMNSGYPFFLYGLFWFTGKSVAAATYVNALLGAVSVGLIYALGARVLASRTAALVAALAWAVYLPAITNCENLAKENLMVPLILGQLLLAVHYRTSAHRPALAAASGVLIGALALVGSAALALVPVTVGAIARTRIPAAAKLRDAGMVVLCAALILGPWLYRNYQILGAPVLNTNGEFNFYLGNNPAATGMFVSISNTPLGPQWEQLRVDAGEVGASRTAGRLALAHIRSHPAETAALAAKKFGVFWYPPVHQGEGGDKSTLETVVRKAWLAQYSLLFLLALVALGFWTRVRYRPWCPALGVLFSAALLYSALHMAFYIVFRYRLSIEPVVALLAAQGAWFIWAWRQAWRPVAAAARREPARVKPLDSRVDPAN